MEPSRIALSLALGLCLGTVFPSAAEAQTLRQRAETHCRSWSNTKAILTRTEGFQRDRIRQSFLIECQQHFDRTGQLLPMPTDAEINRAFQR